MLEKTTQKYRTFAVVAAVTALAGFATVSSAMAAQVDITNANGSASFPDLLLNSNGGLSSDQFAGTTDNGVSVWLRARNKGDQGPVSRSGNTFKIREDSGTQADNFMIDFQFSPKQFDTTNSNYFLELRLDNDPSSSVNFGANTNDFVAMVFDSDGDDELLDSGRSSGTASDRSWDDGDSVPKDLVTTRETGSGVPPDEAVDFQVSSGSRNPANLPDYVVVNSWAAEWNFSDFSLLGDDFGGAPGTGLYDISLTAFEDDSGAMGSELASVQITAQVGEVPVPSSIALLGTALLGTGIVATRRRMVR